MKDYKCSLCLDNGIIYIGNNDDYYLEPCECQIQYSEEQLKRKAWIKETGSLAGYSK